MYFPFGKCSKLDFSKTKIRHSNNSINNKKKIKRFSIEIFLYIYIYINKTP